MSAVVHRAGVRPDVVVLDCDGVIVDSNGAKVDAFRRVALDAGFAADVVDRFSAWQSRNFGVSRYRVFGALVEGRFGAVPPDVAVDGLLDSFSRECRAIYLTVPETHGLREFLIAAGSTPLYVASGSDQTELRVAFESRGLASHFADVLGSPRPKTELLDDIVSRVGPGRSVVMIGDAMADLDAARSAGVSFAFVAAYSTVRQSMTERAAADGFPVYEDLAELAAVLFPRSRSPRPSTSSRPPASPLTHLEGVRHDPGPR